MAGLAGFCRSVEKPFFRTGVAKIVFAGKNSFCHLNLRLLFFDKDWYTAITYSYGFICFQLPSLSLD